MSKRIAAPHSHAIGLEHEHAASNFSGHEQRLVLAVWLHLAEAEESIDFRSTELWNILLSRGSILGMLHPHAFKAIESKRSATLVRRERLLARGWRKGTVQLGQVTRRQANVERGAILPNMSRLARPRDRANVISPQHPGERGLGRRHLMPRGDGPEHRVAQ